MQLYPDAHVNGASAMVSWMQDLYQVDRRTDVSADEGACRKISFLKSIVEGRRRCDQWIMRMVVEV